MLCERELDIEVCSSETEPRQTLAIADACLG
jgi:hypothetical protein